MQQICQYVLGKTVSWQGKLCAIAYTFILYCTYDCWPIVPTKEILVRQCDVKGQGLTIGNPKSEQYFSIIASELIVGSFKSIKDARYAAFWRRGIAPEKSIHKNKSEECQQIQKFSFDTQYSLLNQILLSPIPPRDYLDQFSVIKTLLCILQIMQFRILILKLISGFKWISLRFTLTTILYCSRILYVVS